MENATPDPRRDTIELVKKENPGTELWLGEHPRTGDWWIYRAATSAEVKEYRRLQRVAKEKGDDLEDSYRMLVVGGWADDGTVGCVVYPRKKELKELLARRPMLAGSISADVCDVTGLVMDALQKKL